MSQTEARVILPRQRLVAALDGLPADGVARISAPSGYGKTTLLRTWATAGRSPAAVVSLDGRDNDPLVRADHIWTQWAAATSRGSCRSYPTDAPGNPAQLPESLGRHCAACPATHALLLDDAQHLDQPVASGLLAELLEHQTGRLRLFVACRERLPLPWLQLQSEGRLVEIDASDLAFDRDETRAVLHAVPGLAPTEELLEATEQATRGWPAGVLIAALEAAAASDPVHAVASKALSRRFAEDYFEPDVLRHLSPEVVGFLETTAPLDELRAPLCNALTGRSDAAEVLVDLVHRGVFTERSTDADETFTYHPLFRDALVARLRLRDPDRYRSVLLQASQWYEQADRPDDAVEYALRAQDWGRARSLVADYSGKALAAGRVTSLARWIERLPQDIVQADLELTLLEATVFMLRFDPGRFRDAMRRADRLLDGSDAVTAAAARPALLFLRANDALYRGRLPETVPPLEAALACLRNLGQDNAPLLEPRVHRDSVESALATALLLAGETQKAITFSDRTLTGPSEPNPTAQLRALGSKALALAWLGDDVAAAELAQEAQSVLDRSEVESNDPFLVHLAIAWTRSNPGRAHASLLFVRKLAQQSGLQSFQALAELAAARTALATSHRSAAERAHRKALEHTEALEGPGVLATLTATVGGELRRAPVPDLGDLSPREVEVLQHLASGATRSDVADTLHLSVETVKTHLRRAYRKLGAENRDDALQRAAALGITTSSSSPSSP